MSCTFCFGSSIELGDFKPWNTWTVDKNGLRYSSDDIERTHHFRFIIDQSTGKGYLNESKNVVRFKCALLTLGTPLVHLVGQIVNIIPKFFRLLTFSHFRNHPHDSMIHRFKACGRDFLGIVASPFIVLGLELSAIYGLFRPYDGRKLYATIERVSYGGALLAPCFQPNAIRHLFGGDINQRNAF